MISMINGAVVATTDFEIMVDIGVLTLSVAVPTVHSFATQEKVKLHAYMHWNQEQGPSLFGFATELEKMVFLLVISCSGVGPKLGLAVLADLGAQAFLEAVQAENPDILSKVSGIGAKKAEQIVVQLKHKVAKLISSGIKIEGAQKLEKWNNIAEVLKSLNYSRQEINAALNYLKTTYTDSSVPFDQLMRHGLSFLAKKA